MSSRLRVAAVTAALSLLACGPTPPTTAPATSGQSASPSASGGSALRVDEAAYRVGDSFLLSIGEAGVDWTAPATAPVMPNGQQAVRVAFLPASCATGDFTITADAAPVDAWETDLQEDGDMHRYTMMSWPAAQVPECANGQGWTYLQVAYRPFATLGTIHLVASLTNVTDAPAAVEVVPVFTSADASQPPLTMDGFIALRPVAGPEKPRSAKAQPLFAGPFNKATLPDGTAPTQWGFEVTGCGPVGAKPIVITARVGGAAPIAVGSCSEGSFSNEMLPLPLPADGTPLSVLIAGGTTKSLLRVSEFQWRGARP